MPEREAWARQAGETSRAYSAFCIYRDLRPAERSQRETARRYYQAKRRLNRGQIDIWSVKYNWINRCIAFDEFIDEQKRQKLLDEILDMADRQAKEGTALQTLGARMLASLLAKGDDITGNVLDIVRSLRTGAEIERLARGMPTQIVEEQGVERDFLVIVPPGEKDED